MSSRLAVDGLAAISRDDTNLSRYKGASATRLAL